MVGAFLIVFASTADYLWDEFFGTERPKLIAIVGWVHWYWWVILGLVLMLIFNIEHAHELIKNAKDSRDAARRRVIDTPPDVGVKGYGHYGAGRDCGLMVANPGYVARNVHIPSVQIGDSEYILEFPEKLGQLLIHDQHHLFRAGIKHPNPFHHRDGCQLTKTMMQHNVASLLVTIKYQDHKGDDHKTRVLLEPNSDGDVNVTCYPRERDTLSSD